MDDYTSDYDAETRTLVVKFQDVPIATFENVDNDQAFVQDAISAHMSKKASL